VCQSSDRTCAVALRSYPATGTSGHIQPQPAAVDAEHSQPEPCLATPGHGDNSLTSEDSLVRTQSRHPRRPGLFLLPRADRAGALVHHPDPHRRPPLAGQPASPRSAPNV